MTAAPASARATDGIRTATAADADSIAAIYNAGIAEREATFETDVRAADDVRGWLERDREPVLVAERAGAVVGWARVIRSSDRCAYAGVGEYTIYLDPAARGRGAGRALLDALVAAAERAGYWKLQGKLFTTNAASIALARSCGFREVGVFERHGRLDGAWRDVLVVERLLGEAAR
ncbi:MAG TPA: arsinothricin resistance N-acetyltransferase ArsN1 family A [Solirubrobacteraceae bacterium]|nr:arsinothricin resistance N-acetyltransferase ArsN1 family A [Solirubrobacteraceae bacterium]